MLQGFRYLFRLSTAVGRRPQCVRQASSSKAPPPPPAASFATASQAEKRQEDEEKKGEERKIHEIPLSEAVPGLPKARYVQRPDKDPFATTITALDNGLKVATEAHFGEYCTIGVAIDAGSRYEVAYPSGVSHFIEKLAFNSTLNSEREKAFSVLERYGGLVDCQSTKDTFVYASSCRIDGLDPVLGLIADAVLRPRFTAEEIDTARHIVQFDFEDLNRRPDCEPLLTDWIHAAAYRDNTLGLPKYCPAENLKKIDAPTLFAFMKTHFTPKRIVVAGVGVPHDRMVAAVKRHFDFDTAAWATRLPGHPPSSSVQAPPADASIAQYTGGEVRVERDLSAVSLGPTPYPELAHFVLGLESCSYRDEDFVACCVLNSLMGGGGSFSAGGPGKGMYTRLYTDVLNRHHWMYNATCYNHVYSDTGLFCIHASSDPKHLNDVATVVLKQFLKLQEPFPKEELERAKTQLRSQLMMNMETRPVMFEDVARQVLGHGTRRTPMEYVEQIARIQERDLHRVVERMLCTKASVVGYGALKQLPAYENIDRVIAKRDIKALSSGRVFGLF